MWRTAFSDFRISVKDLIAEGDKVASRVVASGTNTGELMGMPPTGKQVSVSGMEMAHIKDGKVVERWASLIP
jgi:predicted ester cyclase